MKRKLLLCAIGLFGIAGMSVYGATVETKGFLKFDTYFGPLRGGLEGSTLNEAYSDPNFPDTPDFVSYTKGLNGRGVFPDDTHEQYSLRVTGFLTPTVSGDYNFYIRSDDASQFWISPDASEANMVVVAEEYTCCHAFLEPGNTQTTATPIPLVAGQKYAIQVLLKEGGGGDWFEVAWQLASGTTPAAMLTPLQSTVLSSMADPSGGSVTITQQPADMSTAENVPVTFTIATTATTPYKKYTAGGTPAFGGAPPLGTAAQVDTFYQWFTNGVEVAGANGTSFSIAWPKMANNGLKVKCYVAVPGVPVESREATLTVTADTVKPTVLSARADTSFTNIIVKYSEPVSDTAIATANYALDQGVNVLAAGRVDSMTIQLRTSAMAEGKTYKLTINGVQDTATPGNTIVANTQLDIKTFVFLAGTILHKKYTGVDDNTGGNPDNLFNDARFPNNPNRQDLLKMWEYPANGNGRDAVADPARNYFDSIEGFFIPPTSGEYVFLTAGADRWWLYLSTDENPANKKLIAAQPGGWTNPRNWMTGQSTDVTPHRSDLYPSSQWDPPNVINLVAGKKYYLLEVHHDPSWCGADDFAATYKLASDPDPADGDAPKLTGNVIGYYFDPSGSTVSITTQPQNVVTIQGATARFTAAATGQTPYGNTVMWQWQSAPKGSSTFTDIPGATAASYTTPILALADDGKQFRAVATAPPVSTTSAVATVTVSGDSTAPLATVGAMAGATAGTVEIGVAFNEPVNVASAGNLANYSLGAGTITSVKVYTNRFTANSQNPLAKIPIQSVLLTATGVSGSGTLTVKDVADTYGNKMAATPIAFTVNAKMKWGVVGGNEFGGENAAVPVAPNGWDVYSDGWTEWASYDETTFVYEQVTGDFDKKLRVEYQDGSSQWGRAGLIVRDVPNFGVDRATQEGGQAGRYQKVHVNPTGPTLTGPGTPGNNAWECNRRLDTGGTCTSAGGGGTPLYPNAWCRLKRVGQTFTMYRSDDGVNWTQMGTTTWGVDDVALSPMPATVYVGPEYSPEIGNLTQEADRGTFLARFRDYGDYVAAFLPNLQLNKAADGKVTITWTQGTLVSCPTANGAYTPVAGATSPYTVTPAATGATFFRVKQ